MASAWGTAWGDAWGDAWEAAEAPAPAPAPAPAGGPQFFGANSGYTPTREAGRGSLGTPTAAEMAAFIRQQNDIAIQSVVALVAAGAFDA